MYESDVAILAGRLVPRLDPQLRKGSIAMQKWDYLFLTARYEGVWHPWLVDDVAVPNGNRITLAGFMNDLGQQGWELVSTTNVTAHQYNLFFKRPRAGGPDTLA
jgi:hypothetical protein